MTDAAYTAVPNPTAVIYAPPRSEVGFTKDGIWLRCYGGETPHWQVCLAYDPTAEHVYEMWVEHMAAAHPGLVL
jgi:hypothetical protein